MNKEITILELFNSYVKPIKQPRKIKYRNKIYVYDGNAVLGQLINEYKDNIIALLNDKLEILEEDKPIIEKLNLDREPLKGKEVPRAIDYLLEGRINEIIDYINRKEDK